MVLNWHLYLLKLQCQPFHVLRHGGIEAQLFARNRVFKAEMPGMECLPPEPGESNTGRLRQLCRAALHARAIGRVTQQRVADGSHMHADLMGAPGFEAALDL